MLPTSTDIEPLTIESGGPTHVAMSPTRAEGRLPISTVGQPAGRMGPPTCGTGGVPGVTIGQVCRSLIRAAGGMSVLLLQYLDERRRVVHRPRNNAGPKWTSYWRPAHAGRRIGHRPVQSCDEPPTEEGSGAGPDTNSICTPPFWPNSGWPRPTFTMLPALSTHQSILEKPVGSV